MATELAPMGADDWPDVRAIYLEGIATGDAPFERSAPEWNAWDARHLKPCRLLAREGGQVFGWAALSPVSGRCVYGGVAEIVGTRERLGCMDGRWRDVILMERRSAVAGV